MNKKTLGGEILKRIRKDANWYEVLQMTKAVAGSYLLVGGRVYRTALELIHGGDYGADKSDWDFLCTDMTSQPVKFTGWTKVRGPGAVKNSWQKYKNASSQSIANRMVSPAGTPIQFPNFIPQNVRAATPILQKHTPQKVLAEKSCKFVKDGTHGADEVALDLIDLEGLAEILKAPVKPSTYFADVPLNIQAIALDLSSDTIIGHGFEAIFDKKIRLNGTNPTTIMGGDVERYARAKAEALKCIFVPSPKTNGSDCVCDAQLLLHTGCKCGYVEIQRVLKTRREALLQNPCSEIKLNSDSESPF